MLRNERIRIHSYDWLLDKVRNDKDGGPISPVFSKREIAGERLTSVMVEN